MTNTSSEETEVVMMPPSTSSGASSPPPSCEEAEAPAVQMHLDLDDQDQDYDALAAEELVIAVAVGNAAQAYRRCLRSKEPEPHSDDGDMATSASSADDAGADADADPTEMNDDDRNNVVDDDAISTTTKKNESCTTLVEENNTSHTSTLAEAYVGTGVGCGDGDEENSSYKTSSSAPPTQSEQFIQQTEKDDDDANLALTISSKPFFDFEKLGLFLVQAWNWLRYLVVVIIFLNLVRLAEEVRLQFSGSGTVVIGEEVNNLKEIGTESGGEKIANFIKETEAEPEADKMSPNTCSIQDSQQEVVEAAEEAIVAPQGEKAVVQSQPAPVIMTKAEEENANNSAVEEKEEEIEATPVTVQAEEEEKQTEIIKQEEEKENQSVPVVEEEQEQGSEDGEEGLRRDSVDSVSSSGSGNLGDVEDDKSEENNDNESSSGGSDNLSQNGEGEEPQGKEEVALKIISQVEAMFSDEHLAKDGFLLKHVRRRSDGFVSLKLVAGLRKVKQISREFPVVLTALKDSTKLEVNSEGTKVRRVEPLTSFLKAVPIKTKEKEGKQGSSSNEDSQNKSGLKALNKENNDIVQKPNQNRRHSAHIQNNANQVSSGPQSRRNSSAHPNNRKSSNASTTAFSNNSSRHNSFSKPPGVGSAQHPADLFRNVYSSVMGAYSSSGEDQSPVVHRRRGGSLPITALQQRASGSHISPNGSPPNALIMIGPNGGARPKSNSYCEGAIPTGMSPWLQRRKASASSRLSTGELTFNGVVRQPRGPDGTKGFASGYRGMILQERLQTSNSNIAVSG